MNKEKEITENNQKITSLYDYYKNTPKKLKIICDWDEVIQACEPYALWKAKKLWNVEDDNYNKFPNYFKKFWSDKTAEKFSIEYHAYGSRWVGSLDEKQQQIKNSFNFYQEAPFLTIAGDLLRLIKEDKVDKLIFLSAYDKRNFANGDHRKQAIFNETFGKLNDYEKILNSTPPPVNDFACALYLIGFENKKKGANKADWIKLNPHDFDIVIDDNPLICKNVIEARGRRILVTTEDAKTGEKEFIGPLDDKGVQKHLKEKGIWEHRKGQLRVNDEMIVLAPYYPAVINQHHKEVILIKNIVSDNDKLW